MVCTLIDHRNDVIKCSKLKWNHDPLASGFTAKFRTFYGVISMVDKSVDHGKLWSICFYDNIFFSLVVASRPLPTARSDVFLVVFRIFALPLQLQVPTQSQKFLPIC